MFTTLGAMASATFSNAVDNDSAIVSACSASGEFNGPDGASADAGCVGAIANVRADAVKTPAAHDDAIHAFRRDGE
jgi:hypothetical protein